MGSHTVIRKLGSRKYKRLSLRLDASLQKGRFDEAAKYGASIAAVASSTDAVGILVSAAQAYKEGAEKNWALPTSEVADVGIRRAEEVSGVKLTARRQDMIKLALSEAVEQVRSKRRG